MMDLMKQHFDKLLMTVLIVVFGVLWIWKPEALSIIDRLVTAIVAFAGGAAVGGLRSAYVASQPSPSVASPLPKDNRSTSTPPPPV